MKNFIILGLMLHTTIAHGQQFSRMRSNRFTYVSIGAGYPYLGVKVGYEVSKNVFIEAQGLTDGGGIWRTNQFNDWRTVSFVRAIPFPSLRSELRLGMGIVQSEERVLNQKANSFGAAPQLGYTLHLHNHWAASSSITWPLSQASNLTPGVLFGIEYRIGRYVKENGLY